MLKTIISFELYLNSLSTHVAFCRRNCYLVPAWTILFSHFSGVWLQSWHYLFASILAAPAAKAVCNAGGAAGTERCDAGMSAALNQTLDEDATCFAAQIGNVRGFRWCQLDVGKHLFGIYLCKALISHSFFFLAQAPGACGSQQRFPAHIKLGHRVVLRPYTGSGEGWLFTLDQLSGRRATHSLYFSGRKGDAGAGWPGQALPKLLLQQLPVNFAFDIHLPPLQSTVLGRWQHGER